MKTLPLIFTGLLLALGNNNSLHAQNRLTNQLENPSRWEVGVGGGGSLYFGDLTPAKRDYLKEITPYGTALVRYYLPENFSLRGNVCIGQLSGDDSKYSDPEWRQHRNFSFTTTLYEVSLMLEYDLLRGNREQTGSKWGVYAFAGLGLCYTKPQRTFSKLDVGYFGNTDKAVSGLGADLSNESGHVTVVAPVGLGASYQLSKRISLFGEGSVRQGFDDQIDGFSKSVGSSKKDAYAFFTLGLNLRFNGRGWWVQ